MGRPTKFNYPPDIPGDTKECAHCGLTKPVTDFNRNPDGVKFRDHRCRECHQTAARQHMRDLAARRRGEAGTPGTPRLKSAGHPIKRRESKVREAIDKVTGDSKTKKGWVYLIGEDVKGGRRYVKIGESKDHPVNRLAGLQTGNPRRLVLLATKKAADRKALETALHAKFIELNVLGEWFLYTHDIRKEFGLA
jgi:hypothetical protein